VVAISSPFLFLGDALKERDREMKGIAMPPVVKDKCIKKLQNVFILLELQVLHLCNAGTNFLEK